ncbi:hypothetical protein OHB26_31650 [Nocardia sp. NBC_01503]|uniref:hypothetical protein n=1 Tax=Nocardia sp. NBC_01503 TaxID=2975997 RepID=UPI002E7AEB83|nr:hypothetical protein [Nocardia sp. NBC_01503]WTL31426.1 hypothetical protein OHB26_31650 [Nocardia sp. NBC_01503]
MTTSVAEKTAAAPVSATRRMHRPLLAMTVVMAGLALFSLCAMAFDDRMLLHESVWLKPLKFAVAFVLYAFTLAWLLSFPHRGQRLTWWMGTIFAITGVLDVGFIVMQAARGTFSHFNTETDAFNVIGQQVFMTGVPGLFLANLVIAVALSWQRVTDRPLTRAIHAGLAIAVAGMAVAYAMGYSGKQQATDAYGHPIELAAGHTFEAGQPPVRDGVGAMPITHWSTTGGDLRIAHFLGLHGIQVLIVTALLLPRLARRVPWLRTERARADLIWVLALTYAGLFAVIAWQAFRGQALIHPDAATLTGFAAVAAVLVLGTALVYAIRGRRGPSTATTLVTAAAPRPGSVSPISR